jgi:acyl-CoA synthetase (AMP-forming)/AMP-acid ligase II
MLIDDNDNEVQSDDTPGELWLRGPQVMLKYWDNERETRETKTEAGWLKTGDIAITRKDKFFIVDRKKELIKVNGLQVAPAELEAVLLENENIADAGVVGVTLDGNEFPRAYVVLQTRAQGITTSQDIQKFVADRVAKHKRLAGGVQVVPEVPRLASGKILRKQLREWAKRDAGKIKPKL